MEGKRRLEDNKERQEELVAVNINYGSDGIRELGTQYRRNAPQRSLSPLIPKLRCTVREATTITTMRVAGSKGFGRMKMWSVDPFVKVVGPGVIREADGGPQGLDAGFWRRG